MAAKDNKNERFLVGVDRELHRLRIIRLSDIRCDFYDMKSGENLPDRNRIVRLRKISLMNPVELVGPETVLDYAIR